MASATHVEPRGTGGETDLETLTTDLECLRAALETARVALEVAQRDAAALALLVSCHPRRVPPRC